MHGDLLVVGMVLLFGCVAFVFGVIYLTTSVFSFLWRATVGAFFPKSPRRGFIQDAFGGRQVCPRPNCRKIDHRGGAFCAQCGARLG